MTAGAAVAPRHVFDADTGVADLGGGRYAARIGERWTIGAAPNGGYVMSVGVAALEAALPDLVPLSVTAHYLRPAAPGDAEVAVALLKRGRRFATAQASLCQDGREVARLLAGFGSPPAGVVAGDGPAAPPAPRPGAESAAEDAGFRPPLFGPVELRLDRSTAAFARGRRGAPRLVGRARFRDRRPPDPRSLLLFADAFPPAVFNVFGPAWTPTLELTVHVRARPAPGWLTGRFTTRMIAGGLLEEDGELWDADGRLVAMSRQLAAAPRRS